MRIRNHVLAAFLLSIASNSSLAQSQIEEVIVTANKRSESLQDVGSAVTAISGQVMEAANIQDFYDLAEMTPAMVQRSEDETTIRGIGRVGGDASFASTVAVHENGFFLPRGTYWPLLDLTAAEITRGPSGTVFGRNATGGAINIKWRAPEDELSGWADVTTGNYDFKRVRGAVNVPLSSSGDWLSRWTFLDQERDGTLDNVLTPGHLDGHNRDETLGRLFLSGNLSENVMANIRAMYWRRENQYTYARPSDLTVNSGFYESVGGEPPPKDADKAKSDIREVSGGRPGDNRDRRLDFDVNWLIGSYDWIGELSLDFIAGYHKNERRRVVDLDASTTDIIYVDQPAVGDNQSTELRLTTNGDSGVDFMLGLFWAEFAEEAAGTYYVATVPAGADLLLPVSSPVPLPISPTVPVRAEINYQTHESGGSSKAIFLNSTWRLQDTFSSMPSIEFFAGYRVNKDDVATRLVGTQDLFIPDDNPIAVREELFFDVGGDFGENTWELGAKWFATEDQMIYLKRAKGYKSGAVEALPEGSNRVDPEIVNSWELGIKSEFLNRTLQMNLATFYYDYSDLQVLLLESFSSRTENAAKAEVYGVEVEALWQPNDRFTLQLTASYINAYFIDYCTTDLTFPQGSVDPGCEGRGGERDVSGNDVPNAIPWMLATIASYEWPIGRFGYISSMVKFTWSDSYDTHPTNLDSYVLEQYHQTDMHLVWSSRERRWTVDLFVEGIEDEADRYVAPVSIGFKNGLFWSQQLPPKMLGLRVAVKY